MASDSTRSPATPDRRIGGQSGCAFARDLDNADGPLQVVILNADLTCIREPLFIAHYRSMSLTGSEAVIDALVGKVMSRSLAAGLYPDATGSHQIFANVYRDPDDPLRPPRPCIAVVVGLGEEGKLRSVDLTYSVRQAVVAHGLRQAEQDGDTHGRLGIAATLMGSGGTGITPSVAVQAIVQGVLDANQKLQAGGWPQVGRLTLVELYLERAAEAWRALKLQEQTAPHPFALAGRVRPGPGALRRSLDAGYRGSSHDLLSVRPVEHAEGGLPGIAYTLDSKRARTEIRAQHAQGALLRELVERASNDARADPQIGRTLYNLLIPLELESFLSGTREMVIEVRPGTAGIPWELLATNPDPQSTDTRPWAIRSKLVRKLQLEDFRPRVQDAMAQDNVLVIGEPQCDPGLYPPLEGARREATAVAQRLKAAGGGLDADRVTALVAHDDAQTIINALFARSYRAVHIAGHGEPGPQGGVVLSGPRVFLGAHEVQAMRTVPELVFLNCCHLAARDASTTLTRTYDRASFAANIAEALIAIGVRCVIAAGWAVEDEPAERFAIAFYDALLAGARFIEAVGAAREAAWQANPQGTTWAAYQCYGDPAWNWRQEGADPQRPPPSPDESAAIASPVSLTLALETLARGTAGQGPQSEVRLAKLRRHEDEFASTWGHMGEVAESFGTAYAAAGANEAAIAWLERALRAPDGGASVQARWHLADALLRRARIRQDGACARADIEAAITQLEPLLMLRPTAEREGLMGAAWGQLALFEGRAGQAVPARAALGRMARHCDAAQALAQADGGLRPFHFGRGALAARLRAAFLEGAMPPSPDEALQTLARALDHAEATEPDFDCALGRCELRLLSALAHGVLADAAPLLQARWRELRALAPTAPQWPQAIDDARFTLEPYAAMARAGDEMQAVQSILNTLESLTT